MDKKSFFIHDKIYICCVRFRLNNNNKHVFHMLFFAVFCIFHAYFVYLIDRQRSLHYFDQKKSFLFKKYSKRLMENTANSKNA